MIFFFWREIWKKMMSNNNQHQHNWCNVVWPKIFIIIASKSTNKVFPFVQTMIVNNNMERKYVCYGMVKKKEKHWPSIQICTTVISLSIFFVLFNDFDLVNFVFLLLLLLFVIVVVVVWIHVTLNSIHFNLEQRKRKDHEWQWRLFNWIDFEYYVGRNRMVEKEFDIVIFKVRMFLSHSQSHCWVYSIVSIIFNPNWMSMLIIFTLKR